MTSKVKRCARPTRVTRSLGRAALVGAVAVGLVAGGGGAAWAWWTASSAVTASVATDTNKPPRPGTITCQNAGLAVRIYFTAPVTPAVPPVPAGLTFTQDYVITVKDSGGRAGTPIVKKDASGYQTIGMTDIPGILIGSVSVWVQTRYTFQDGSAPFLSDPQVQPVTQFGFVACA